MICVVDLHYDGSYLALIVVNSKFQFAKVFSGRTDVLLALLLD